MTHDVWLLVLCTFGLLALLGATSGIVNQLLTVRFIIGTHRIRTAKDAMSRHIITALDEAVVAGAWVGVGLPQAGPSPSRAARPGA